ncbi:hypothetical protein Q4610_15435 [Sphingobium sp. HBC34]|uniref:Uncharacterized protein n=1 Tax=Sphingobium cyanobacteriorum TaxID=3063954 RepID=A0ABT8ZPH9_9SPHN|nr:hypothetical protein [Sphingobium sp. HBC34]MDO7836442.1 hypothetical protein [Sphingobium sp. HBC34]
MTHDLGDFGATTPTWIEQNCPADMRSPVMSEDDDAARRLTNGLDDQPLTRFRQEQTFG